LKGKKQPIRAVDSLVKLTGLNLDSDLVRFITTLTYEAPATTSGAAPRRMAGDYARGF
jgi:hypothetical protein